MSLSSIFSALFCQVALNTMKCWACHTGCTISKVSSNKQSEANTPYGRTLVWNYLCSPSDSKNYQTQFKLWHSHTSYVLIWAANCSSSRLGLHARWLLHTRHVVVPLLDLESISRPEVFSTRLFHITCNVWSNKESMRHTSICLYLCESFQKFCHIWYTPMSLQ